jgi:hypothetical protein
MLNVYIYEYLYKNLQLDSWLQSVKHFLVGFEVLTLVSMKNSIFWDIITELHSIMFQRIEFFIS